jgi:hypothetical protein
MASYSYRIVMIGEETIAKRSQDMIRQDVDPCRSLSATLLSSR